MYKRQVYADRVARERGKSPKDGPVKAAKAKLDACDKKIAGIEDELKEVRKRMEDKRKPLRSDPEFQKYEAYCDDGIDLARLTYNEMRGLRGVDSYGRHGVRLLSEAPARGAIHIYL